MFLAEQHWGWVTAVEGRGEQPAAPRAWSTGEGDRHVPRRSFCRKYFYDAEFRRCSFGITLRLWITVIIITSIIVTIIFITVPRFSSTAGWTKSGVSCL